jgi:hypothetical protein
MSSHLSSLVNVNSQTALKYQVDERENFPFWEIKIVSRFTDRQAMEMSWALDLPVFILILSTN